MAEAADREPIDAGPSLRQRPLRPLDGAASPIMREDA